MINNDYDEFDDLEDYDEEVEEENENFHEVKISYAQYKNEYSDYKTKEKSYDKGTKTIIVYFPVQTMLIFLCFPTILRKLLI